VVAKVSLYTFFRKWQEKYNRFPSYNEVNKNVVLRILGDDAIRKYSRAVDISEDELIEDALKYGLQQTPPKEEGNVSFCSRSYVKHQSNIYFPRLKKSSITSCLFWFKSLLPSQIKQNCFTALMEAGLHEKDFYEKVCSAVGKLARIYGFELDYVSHTQIQQLWCDYIIGKINSPVWGDDDPVTQTNSKRLSMADMWINEFVQKNKLEVPIYQYYAEGPDNILNWTCKGRLQIEEQEYTGTGVSDTKAEAKRQACQEIKDQVEGKVTTNSARDMCYVHEGKRYHSDECEKITSLKKGPMVSKIEMVKFLKSNYKSMVEIEDETIKTFQKTKCIDEIRAMVDDFLKREAIPKMREKIEELRTKFEESGKLTVDDIVNLDRITQHMEDLSVSANMAGGSDMPVEPATMNQAMQAEARVNLPSAPNPQPTAMAPAMTAPGDDIMAAVQIAETMTLVPVGAPNMLSVGAIGFDLKSLIYEQFLDADQEYSITESAATGAIVLQIPYAATSPFNNQYIRAYASMHGRYAGAISYRITVIGNQLLSGALGVCWQPTKVEGSTIIISEAQRFSYVVKSVAMPWNTIMTLHDARKSEFWRSTSDDLGDLSQRPHLVIFTALAVYNPYRDNTLVRIRIASKLNNASEPNPFIFAAPSLTPTVPVEGRSGFETFDEYFKQVINNPISIYTDGTRRGATDYTLGERYQDFTDMPQNPAITAKWMQATGIPRTGGVAATSFYLAAESEEFWPTITEFWRGQSAVYDTYNKYVGIYYFSTMDATHHVKLGTRIPIPGFFPYSTTTPSSQDRLDEVAWNNAKNWTKYVSFVTEDPELKVILYNQTQYRTMDVVVEPTMTDIRYAAHGYIKIITNQGTAFLFLTSYITQRPDSVNLSRLCQLPHQGVVPPKFPFINVDEQLGSIRFFESLPTGFQNLLFTTIPPSSLTVTDYPDGTATNDATIERWFYRMAKDLPLTQCIQLILVDQTSQRIIAYVRYFQEWRQFVINTTSPNYRVLTIGTSNLVIQAIEITNRTNAFPETNTDSWFSRTSTVFGLQEQYCVPTLALEAAVEEIEVVANAQMLAMMAGGGLSGIGQAIGQMQQYKQDEKMQSNLFTQQQKLQHNQFGHDVELQGNMFAQQNYLQGTQNAFNEMMQQNQFAHNLAFNKQQASEQRATNAANAQNEMTVRGLSTRVNFLRQGGESSC
jgi:hypothetical protein